jgi:hypothetical protein
MDMLEKLMQDKMKKGPNSSDKEQDPKKKAAMLGVLDHISKMAEGAMDDDMKNNIPKVTVAASDDEGLKKGLKMAEGIVGRKNEPLHSDDMDNETPEESEHLGHEQEGDTDPGHHEDEEEDEEEEESGKY